MLRTRREELETTIKQAYAELEGMDPRVPVGAGQERAYTNMQAGCNLKQESPEETIDYLFTFHDDPDKTPHYVEIREAAKTFAKVIMRHTPGGADRLTAINKLREVVMFANANIALSGRGI